MAKPSPVSLRELAAALPRGEARGGAGSTGRVRAVLGPTNTGKTHLAIERLCAHSSGMIGFPLRLLAREVYDRVCAIKGPGQVALITGEERIEPKGARWHLCTMEAMPLRPDVAFVALDEVQLCADRERGHVFTNRLLHTRGREETMFLGSATIAPLVKALVPEAEIVSRPRFSTLTHAGARKLSRIPPRSAIVAFSAEQVYAVAEMLRRFRGGAAVVMGALSPETRNRQVALFQSGEVDYLVATDAIGMGLNLDVTHVAFAGLSKYDGVRHRRLTPAEMAQIAGRAGRHQRDGTFGTLSGGGHGGHDVEFTEEEIYAIEEHRFAPLTKLFWRQAEPRFTNLATLIGDLETPPARPELAPAPQAIDLGVLKALAEDPAIAGSLRTPGLLRRFWQVCSLPDFRQQGVETHARFVARLWEELRHGPLKPGHVPAAIAQLDNTQGDIDTLQGRIAAIRSWAYIAQRPDWVPAREEMAERTRAVEARLSDALHARLTERFVNRRTTVLMRKLGSDAGLLPVRLEEDTVLVEDEPIGTLHAFRFRVDPQARHADQKLLLAAAEKHLPALLAARAETLASALEAQEDVLAQDGARLLWQGEDIARLKPGRTPIAPLIAPAHALDRLPAPLRARVAAGLENWLAHWLRPLAPLARLEAASREAEGGSELRAVLIRLVDEGGVTPRATSGVDALNRPQRERLRRLGVKVGALDVFVPALLRPAPLERWQTLVALHRRDGVPVLAHMPPVAATHAHAGPALAGYRRVGHHWLRIDMAEKLLHAAHAGRTGEKAQGFVIDPALARSMGLDTASFARLLRTAGFRPIPPRPLAEAAHGPPAPLVWRWRPPRPASSPAPRPARPTGAFAALAGLMA